MNESKKKDQGDCFGGNCYRIRETTDSNSSDNPKKYACMSACRWFPLVPVALGVVAVTAGYVLSPSAIKMIWLAFSMAIVGFGLFALVMMRTMAGKSGKISCC
jgi:hypothetical protein